MKSFLPVLATVLMMTGAVAQVPTEVGFDDLVLPNISGVGNSPTLPVRIFYPSIDAGGGAPFVMVPGGYPAIVFLPGVSHLGSQYEELIGCWVQSGFVVFAYEVATSATDDISRQVFDAHALHTSVTIVNSSPTGEFFELIDPSRIAISGHSLGGGNSMRLLANNPGYVAACCLAPIDPSWAALHGADIEVPFLLIHGMGDVTVPWQSSQTYFELTPNFTGTKTLKVMNMDTGHENIIGWGTTPTDQAIFDHTVEASIGFFKTYLADDTSGFEMVGGPTSLANPDLALHAGRVKEPVLWTDTPVNIGNEIGIHTVSEPGHGALFVSLVPGYFPTPYGLALLDPLESFRAIDGFVMNSGETFSLNVTVPSDPFLIGVVAHMQSIAFNVAGQFRFSNRLIVTVGS